MRKFFTHFRNKINANRFTMQTGAFMDGWSRNCSSSLQIADQTDETQRYKPTETIFACRIFSENTLALPLKNDPHHQTTVSNPQQSQRRPRPYSHRRSNNRLETTHGTGSPLLHPRISPFRHPGSPRSIFLSYLPNIITPWPESHRRDRLTNWQTGKRNWQERHDPMMNGF